MAKKKNNNQKTDEDKGSSGGGGTKKADVTVVLKTEMHCEGCTSKITKIARSIQGVDSVKADTGSGKLTVVGWIDPVEVRDHLQLKAKKKFDLVSPLPKNDAAKKQPNDNKKAKSDNNSNNNNNNNNNSGKISKEAQLTTAVIKMGFHCQGCIEKIQSIVSKTKGVQEMKIDKEKETVTVTGTMDVKALTEALRVRLKRNVEIVPPKKEKEKEKEKKEEGESSGGGGGKKKKGGGGGEENAGGGVGGVMFGENRMEYLMQPGFWFGPGYGSSMGHPAYGPEIVGQPVYPNGFVGQPVYPNGFVGQPVYPNGFVGQPVYEYGQENGYGYGTVPGFPAHMKFNDENPNACTIM